MSYDGSVKFDTGMDFNGFQEGANKFTSFVKGMSVFKLLEKGFQAVAGSIDSAVKRYDTLNKFPKILEQMGYSAGQASAATQKLSDGVTGLPTTLDDIVANTQQLVTITKDLDKSTNLALALNDAFLASGSSSQDAARGTTQFVQMLSKGKVDMQSWMTLQETMAYGLDQVAQSFGFAGSSARADFYEALKSGQITFDQFSDKLIELDAGVGGFAEMAKTATGGIATAWTNMKTAITRGTTEIIKSIDKGLSQTKFKSIENIIDTLKTKSFKTLKGVADLLYPIAANIDTIIPLLIAVGAAMAAWKVGTVLQAVRIGFQTAAKDVGLYAMSVNGAITVDALHTAGLTAKAIIVGVLTGQIGLATAAQYAWNTAIEANPIGVFVAGLIAAAGAVTAVYTAFGKANPALRETETAVKGARSATKDLKNAIKDVENSSSEMQNAAKANAEAIRSQTDDVYKAIDAYNRGEISLERLQAVIQILSKSCGGLEISFDETNGTLSITREELEKLADAAEEAKDVDKLSKNVDDLNKTLTESKDKLKEVEKQQEKWLTVLKTGQGDVEEATQKLTALGQEHDALSEQIEIAEGQLKTASEELTSAIETEITERKALTESEIETIRQYAIEHGLSTDAIIADMERQGITFDEYKTNFEELQEAVEERTDNITNSFKKIPEKFDMSAKEMLENLQANKETYAKWEANMDEITRLLGPTFANEMRQLGPEANSAMEEILKSPELLDQYRQTLGIKVDEATGTAIEDWNDPNFIGASSDAFSAGAVILQNNTDLPDAAKSKVEETAEAMTSAVDSADFSSVGDKVAEAVTGSIKNIDVPAKKSILTMMQGIAKMITSSTPSVSSAMETLSRKVMQTVDKLKADAPQTLRLAMALFVSGIAETAPGAASAAQKVTKGAVNAINAEKSNAYNAGYNVGYNAGSGVLSGLSARESAIYSKARTIANNVAATMRRALDIHSPSKVSEWLFKMFIKGGEIGAENEADVLYRTIDDIADETIDRMSAITNAMDDTFNRKMQVAVSANQSKAAVSAQTGAVMTGAAGGGKQVTNNYNMSSTFNSPAALSWRDMKLFQQSQAQQHELLGG